MDVTDNGEDSQQVPEGLTQATSAGEESAGEAPAPEAPAAMATDEGRSTAEEWLEQISKHLHHIEGRLMEEGFLGHEVVRQIGILLEGFSPPPRGEFGWLLRRSQDIGTRTLRQLIMKYGQGSHEAIGALEVRAIHIVRLYVEEAVHRQLLSCETDMQKAALCSLMESMRNFEEHAIPQDPQHTNPKP